MPNRLLKLKHPFIWIALLVVTAHMLALWGLGTVQSIPAPTLSAPSDTVFSTRTIAATTPALVPQSQAAPPRATSSAKKPTRNKATNTAATPMDAPGSDPAEPGSKLSDSTSSDNTTSQQDTTTPAEETLAEKNTTEINPIHDTEPAPKDSAPLHYLVAPPTLLKYDIKGEIKGFAYFANGELRWQHQGSHYEAQLEISHFLLGSRTQTSSGQITAHGLKPLRFADKVRSEVYAQFDHTTQQITFSADGTQTALETGAQDQLSVFIQLGALLAGSPEHFPTGARLSFQAVGARSAEHWIFEIGSPETLDLPGGKLPTTKLKRIATDPGGTQVEVWLAPSMHFLPVRIRLFQANGDFVEQQWRSSRKP